MLDIETLSLSTHNALVLSVGAVRFVLKKGGIAVTAHKLWVLDMHAQIVKGREISAETQKFWREQSDEARAHWINGTPVSVRVALGELADFIPQKDTPIWSNGCCFDIGNLESLYQQFERPIPWRYNAVRDARTIYKSTVQLRERPPANAGAAHDPVNDCINQIWGLWEHCADADLE